jgi:hypothetical protein
MLGCPFLDTPMITSEHSHIRMPQFEQERLFNQRIFAEVAGLFDQVECCESVGGCFWSV